MKSHEQYRQHIKRERDYWNRSKQSKLIFRCKLWRREQDDKNWAPKYQYFATVWLVKMCKSSVLIMKFKLVKHEGNQLWLFLEGLMLNMKSQYIGHLRPRAKPLERNWYWERFRAGGEGNERAWDGCKHHWLKGHGFGKTVSNLKGREAWGFCCTWSHKESDKSEWLNNIKILVFVVLGRFFR